MMGEGNLLAYSEGSVLSGLIEGALEEGSWYQVRGAQNKWPNTHQPPLQP